MNKFNNVTVSLARIFPPVLLLIVFSPLVVGLVIDPKLIEATNVTINLVWVSLFTIPNVWFKRKWIYRFTLSVFFFFGLLELLHWIIMKGPITLTSLMVMSNTNAQEAVEFMGTKANLGLLIIVPYVLCYIYALRKVPSFQYAGATKVVVPIVLLFSVGFIAESVINQRFIRKATPPVVRVFLSFVTQQKLFNEAMQVNSPRNIAVTPVFDSSSQTFVLILGESCNRNHMSLYGASPKTNPLLEKRTDIITYNNVVSPYSCTIYSVLSILSDASLDQPISPEKSIDLIDVFHSAGFKTFWISNQSPVGVWDNQVTVLAKKTDSPVFVNTTGNSSFEATQTISYDSKLFAPFAQALADDAPRKFIVLHLMGSHTAYDKRYPQEFNVFKGENHRGRVIARYKNSILYNDFVVDSLLNMVQLQSTGSSGHLASVVYLADHAENVYDEGNNAGHNYTNRLPKANVEIPFVVWLSPAYTSQFSARVNTLKANRNMPFVADDFFHAALDLSGITCSQFVESRSIFNEHFNFSRKRILEDGKDYDQP